MSENTIVNISSLPFPPEESGRILQEYFPEHLCKIIRQNTTTTTLSLQKDYGWYYALENSTEALKWWGGKNFQPNQIMNSFLLENNSMITLLDSWSAYAWSYWLHSLTTPPKECVLIHLDDHDDLMSPHIGISPYGWYDLITKRALSFNNPRTVFSSIKSGSIGIGSMLTIPCFHFEKIHILHCQQSIHYQHSLGNFKLVPTHDHDAILEPYAHRAAVDISKEQSKKYNGSNYIVTNNFGTLLSNCPKNLPILLHIDMDFFNNRYNGDTDWQSNKNKVEPTLSQQLKQISEFFQLLEYFKVVEFVQHITIAISPGFYPCEFWETAVNHLLNEAISHGLNLEKIKTRLQK